jgi:maltose alpha-D-glucosyltransferase/alpha-amylase
VWLLPIYPSPLRDGYDIADFYRIHPDFGTLEDFKLLERAHLLGMRVILGLVLNHTSDQHPGSRRRGPTGIRPTALLRVARHARKIR